MNIARVRKIYMNMTVGGLFLFLFLCGTGVAWSMQAGSFSPQGSFVRISRVEAGFDVPVTALGSGAAIDPYLISCSQGASGGRGRWVDPQHWVYTFDQELAGSVSCSARVNPEFRSLDGAGLSDPVYRFSTGGPHGSIYLPWGRQIAEDQVFALTYNVAVDVESLLERTSCHVQGLGETVPVRLIGDADRAAILESVYDSDRLDDPGVQLVQCKRRLPSGAQVRLVVEPGVLAAGSAREPDGGTAHETDHVVMASQKAVVREFKVRDAFQVFMSCSRVNSSAPCSPLSPIWVRFSTPVPPAQAARIQLGTADGDFSAPGLETAEHQGGASLLDSISFRGPFPENSTLRLHVPADLQDDAGRTPANASAYPMQVPIDFLPPLVRFPSGSFGIVERFAEGAPQQDPDMLVPLALRRVEKELRSRELAISAGQLSDHVTTDDVQALHWFARVQRLQEGVMGAGQMDDVLASRPMREFKEGDAQIDVRARSIFGPGDTVRDLKLPGLQEPDGQDIEMIGIPLQEPGLHVIEVRSARLGSALLGTDEQPGPAMHVRSAVLLTNLAVHVKLGRDDSLVWVTTLDQGLPVEQAQVAILSCRGERLLSGQTDASGVLHIPQALPSEEYCSETGQSGLFVTARIPADHAQAHGKADFSFAWSDWGSGIEPWRFGVYYNNALKPDQLAHAVLDRKLLRVGETVSMKLFVRDLGRKGVQNPARSELPESLRIVHQGSGDETTLPVEWQTSSGGGLYALLEHRIPETARPGTYDIEVDTPADPDADEYSWRPSLHAGSFRVESFKLPLLTGSLKIAAMAADTADAATLIAPASVQAGMQFSFISGGPASDLDVSLSAVSRPRVPAFPDYENYSFGVSDYLRDTADMSAIDGMRRLLVDKQAVQMDAEGGGQLLISGLEAPSEAQSWLFEASFSDPNGDIQTIARDVQVWPADVVVGLQAGSWVSRGETATAKLLALDTDGKPQADVPVRLDGRIRTTYTVRKRLVGGFYSYDTHEQLAGMGTLCEGRTNAQGLLECPVRLDQDGEIQLFAQAVDTAGRVSRAADTIWVWGDAAWFGGGQADRIDLIPARSSWKPGETAEITVRMPYRQARALVAIEREGVLESFVTELHGEEPVIRLPVSDAWGPNVYVSVLAVRGRIRAVPWSSFFEWGWRKPLAWWQAHSTQTVDAPLPSGLLDLARPSFRFGLTQLQVSSDVDRLQVSVSTEQHSYQVREEARAEVEVRLPDGSPAAGASVAFAAVDEALLELEPNNSWDLLQAMRAPHDYGVLTASALGEVVGRRHYGRKAVPVGGGGGAAPTRELFDTLLLWRGDVTLDEQGRAGITVPLNDALSRFRLVAVADAGEGMFGTGSTDIVSTQDLQLIPGLPRIVRENDQYQADVTVRNRTGEAMTVRVTASVEGGGQHDAAHDTAGQAAPAAASVDGQQAGGNRPQQLGEKTVEIPAGGAQLLSWPMQAPMLGSTEDAQTLRWLFEARAVSGPSAQDSLSIEQTLMAAVPVAVQQASLLQLRPAHAQTLPIDAGRQAQRNAAGQLRGGVDISLQSHLAGTLPGVADWLAAYPYTCVEQLGAKAMGMQDEAAWDRLMQRLALYQDESGLIAYFPAGQGSVALTAQLIELSEHAARLGWNYSLPPQARERMLAALQDFVMGRLDDTSWAPLDDSGWRKLLAVDALAQAGAWQEGMLDSFNQDISAWPSAAVVTWMSVLRHLPEHAREPRLQAAADAVMRTRLSRHGTSLLVADESATMGWWLMSNQATVQARLLLAVADRPEWSSELGPLMSGLLSLQDRGAWSTTTANVLGVLAANAYTRQAEAQAGQGVIAITLDGLTHEFQWADMPAVDGVQRAGLELPWPASGEGALGLKQSGEGSGWATVTARSAITLVEPLDAGMEIRRSITPVSRKYPDRWVPGDIYRVQLQVRAREPLMWAVISDPVPAGAGILGSGLGRDSQIAIRDESQDQYWWQAPSWVERDAGVFRAYYESMQSGWNVIEYTVRLNTPGTYAMPPTRAEALYQPDLHGALPNDVFHIDSGDSAQ